MRKIKLSLASLALLISTTIPLLLISVCNRHVFPHANFPITDSGAWTEINQPFVWLDDSRLVFTTSESMRPDVQHLARATWTLGHQPIVDWKNFDTLWCFDGRELGFKQKGGGYPWIKGAIGDEKQWDRRNCQPSNAGFIFPSLHGGTCDCDDEKAGPWRGRHVRLLRKGHGWLDMGSDASSKSQDNLPVTFYSGSGTPIVMPFRSREIGAITFHQWRNSYFIEGEYFNAQSKGGVSPWPKDLERYAWWLGLDGAVTKVVIPPSMKERKGSWDELVPTKIGITTVSRSGWKSDSDPGDQGVYLIQGEYVTKLLDGMVERFGASPDGCKLAISSAPNNSTNHLGEYAKVFRTLKVISLCSATEGK